MALLTAALGLRHRRWRAPLQLQPGAVANHRQSAVDSVAGHRVSPGGGRHQPDAGAADRHRGVAGILFSWNIEHRAKEFFAFYLALIGGVYGVFLSFDLFLLFVFYELAIIPKYFLIAIWGSTRQEYGAMKLALYSFVGSAMVLIGLIAAYVVAGGQDDERAGTGEVSVPARLPDVGVPAGVRRLRHPGRPVAVPHLGADRPRGGADGGLDAAGGRGDEAGRLRLPARGDDAVSARAGAWGFSVLGFGSWRDVLRVLAVIGIVYGAMVALVQKDFKFVIGYSSVSHMGFVLLGLDDAEHRSA